MDSETKNKGNNESYEPTQQDNPSRKSCWWNEPIEIFTFFVAAFTLCLVVVGVFQCRTLMETNRASQVRDQSYVYFANPETFPYPRPPAKPITTGVTIALVNRGNIPGRIVSVRSGWITKWENTSDPFRSADLMRMEATDLIGAKEAIFLQGKEIPVPIYEAAIEGRVNILVLMEVKYSDKLDPNKIRTTRTSRSLRFDPHGGQSWGSGPGSCIDDDCHQ